MASREFPLPPFDGLCELAKFWVMDDRLGVIPVHEIGLDVQAHALGGRVKAPELGDPLQRSDERLDICCAHPDRPVDGISLVIEGGLAILAEDAHRLTLVIQERMRFEHPVGRDLQLSVLFADLDIAVLVETPRAPSVDLGDGPTNGGDRQLQLRRDLVGGLAEEKQWLDQLAHTGVGPHEGPRPCHDTVGEECAIATPARPERPVVAVEFAIAGHERAPSPQGLNPTGWGVSTS